MNWWRTPEGALARAAVGYRELPTVLVSAPLRWRWRHGLGPEQSTLERLVAACARLRTAVEAAGQARAACYAAAGKPVPPEIAPPDVHTAGLPRAQAHRRLCCSIPDRRWTW